MRPMQPSATGAIFCVGLLLIATASADGILHQPEHSKGVAVGTPFFRDVELRAIERDAEKAKPSLAHLETSHPPTAAAVASTTHEGATDVAPPPKPTTKPPTSNVPTPDTQESARSTHGEDQLNATTRATKDDFMPHYPTPDPALGTYTQTDKPSGKEHRHHDSGDDGKGAVKPPTTARLPKISKEEEKSKSAHPAKKDGFFSNLWQSLAGRAEKTSSTMTPRERWASLVFSLLVFGGVGLCAAMLLFRVMRNAMGRRRATSGYGDVDDVPAAGGGGGGGAGGAALRSMRARGTASRTSTGTTSSDPETVAVISVADQIPQTSNSSRQRVLERVRLAGEKKAQYGATGPAT